MRGVKTGLRLAEPDVSLTDYALAAETAWFAYRLLRLPRDGEWLRDRYALFFGSACAASLAGGTVHGFLPEAATAAHRALWSATLLAIGASSVASWSIGARLALSGEAASRVEGAAAAGFVGYAAVVLRGERRFAFAVFAYAPATVFLLFAYNRRYTRTGEREVLVGALGLLLALVAAAGQRRKVGLPALRLSHNALYHVFQGVALGLFHRSAGSLIRRGPNIGGEQSWTEIG